MLKNHRIYLLPNPSCKFVGILVYLSDDKHFTTTAVEKLGHYLMFVVNHTLVGHRKNMSTHPEQYWFDWWGTDRECERLEWGDDWGIF